ncbi:hypothetical protein ACX0G9_23045 [Flavitalea flava]
MNQEAQQSHEVFMELLVKKQEQQDHTIQDQGQKITGIRELINDIPNYSEDIRRISTGQKDIKTALDKLQFPTGNLQEFSNKLTVGINLLRQPVAATTIHQHHVPKIMWISAGLFLALCLACSGWLMTASKLDQYKANDTKYRYLKLKSNPALLEALSQLDSLYRSPFALKDSVIQGEEDVQKEIELNRRLKQKQGEGEALNEERKAMENKNKARKNQ